MSALSETPLLTLAIVLLGGVFSGQLARLIRLPRVTGQIVIGVILGPSVLALVDLPAIHALRPVTHFALGLIAVTLGSHLHFRKLRNAARRLLWLLLLESTLIPLLVFLAAMATGDVGWSEAFLLAALAISTAPATILALVKETRSRGVFVKTVVAAVALNNIACIAIFEFAHAAARLNLAAGEQSGLRDLALQPLLELAGSALLGFAVGAALIFSTRRIVRSDQLSTASMMAILVAAGLSEWLELSSLLACLFLGMTLANLTPDKEEIGHGVFENFAAAIYAIFFTLAGMELQLEMVPAAGLLAGVVIVARIVGKVFAGHIAMRLSGAPDPVRRYLGWALLPQAGVAVGLVLLVQDDPALASIAQLILAVGLTMVTAAEIIGPVLTRWSLARSGDFGKDRARLMDFIREENITTDLRGPTKREAIEQMAAVLIRSQGSAIDREKFLASVFEREAQVSTCIGEGLAVPHGVWEGGKTILGALGISRDGLELETPDGLPVYCMLLLATPPEERDRHLEVIGAFARTVHGDANVQRQLYHAKTPAHAALVLHADEADFNYFLED
ncbi:MAG TPA: cation:proton antiporter [Candidatus Krumholzibacteria bacterium]|jgi:Kef-type K+ transport system membrane component KefB/mannitol/fructose-specific phosphotransferase system IIA component